MQDKPGERIKESKESKKQDASFEKEALLLCIKIMIENADIDLSTVTPNDYLSSSFANNLSFSPSGEQDLMYIPIYSLLMSKLLSLNAKRAREKSQRLRSELKEFEKQYDRIFYKHLKSPSLDSAKALDEIKRESKDFLSTTKVTFFLRLDTWLNFSD